MDSTCPECASERYFGTLPNGAVSSCFECGYSPLIGARKIPRIETIPATGQSSGNLSGKKTRFTPNMDALILPAILSNSSSLKDAADMAVSKSQLTYGR